jgi:hypothetical protein
MEALALYGEAPRSRSSTSIAYAGTVIGSGFRAIPQPTLFFFGCSSNRLSISSLALSR